MPMVVPVAVVMAEEEMAVFKSFRQIREANKAVWDKPNPKAEAGKSEKLSPGQKARAQARARSAGRSYPNMVDNIWAARNEAIQPQDAGEYDYEGDMAQSDLRSIIHNAQRLHDMMEKTTNLPEWVQAKITKAEDYISSATDYMQSQMNEELGPENDIGTPALTKKLLKLTPGQLVKESGGPVVYKSGAGHVEKYSDNSFAVYKNGTKKTFYTTLDAAKKALTEEEKKNLNKPFLTPGGPKKRSVYVKDPSTGNVKKVNFGDTTGLTIKTSDPDRRRNFRARHNCDTPGPKTKARYWSCKAWSADTVKKGLGENFKDGRNPQDRGDAERHGLKGKSAAELRSIRSSSTASPRKKQLAHWLLNFHHNKKS